MFDKTHGHTRQDTRGGTETVVGCRVRSRSDEKTIGKRDPRTGSVGASGGVGSVRVAWRQRGRAERRVSRVHGHYRQRVGSPAPGVSRPGPSDVEPRVSCRGTSRRRVTYRPLGGGQETRSDDLTLDFLLTPSLLSRRRIRT